MSLIMDTLLFSVASTTQLGASYRPEGQYCRMCRIFKYLMYIFQEFIFSIVQKCGVSKSQRLSFLIGLNIEHANFDLFLGRQDECGSLDLIFNENMLSKFHFKTKMYFCIYSLLR